MDRASRRRLPALRRAESAFTMVEIAISLAIIAFALVAIIGVLPAGLKVQQENREDTVINQEGLYLLEAIRSGSKGLDVLTNHVEAIRISFGPGNVFNFTNHLFPGPSFQGAGVSLPLTNGFHIIGLLSTPSRVFPAPGAPVQLSQVDARVRAITGVASEKSKQIGDLVFRYQARVEIEPFVKPPLLSVGNGVTVAPGALQGDVNVARSLRENLHEIRLTLRWPVYLKGDGWEVGRNRKTFRTLVHGDLAPFRATRAGSALYFFEPNAFTSITNLIAGD